jgi:hypothetical protein
MAPWRRKNPPRVYNAVRAGHAVFLIISYEKGNPMSEFIATLPSLGAEAGDHAKVSFIYVNEGDTIDVGGDLIEMVTDKATFNVPAPCAGKIVEILVREDDDVKVGQEICRLEV